MNERIPHHPIERDARGTPEPPWSVRRASPAAWSTPLAVPEARGLAIVLSSASGLLDDEKRIAKGERRGNEDEEVRPAPTVPRHRRRSGLDDVSACFDATSMPWETPCR